MEVQMAALLKDHEEQHWTYQSVPSEGLAKMMKAVQEQKKPSEALKKLMRSEGKSSK
jgi:hypothetical protein